MRHEERIERYMSGAASPEECALIENAMLERDDMLALFALACEQSVCHAPDGFADAVMNALPRRTAVTTAVPFMSRRMCAAACFCSAAAIMMFSVLGIDLRFIDFFAGNIVKLSDLLNTINIL